MFCKYCGKEVPDGSEYCRFCGQSLTSDAETDDYGVYDEYVTDEEVAPEDALPEDIPDDEPDEEPDTLTEGRRRRVKKVGKGAVAACVVLAILMGLFMAAAALSGIARYVIRDQTVKETVINDGFDDYPVNTGEEKKSFSDYLCDITEQSGKDLGFKKRDIVRLLKNRSFREYFAEIIVDHKTDLFKGSDLKEYDCADIADWMFSNADTVKNITGVNVDAAARDKLKSGLDDYTLDFGKEPFKETFGVDRGFVTFFTSEIFLFVSLVLCLGLASLIFITSDFNAKFFFTCVGMVFLAVGIVLLGVFGFLMIAGSGSGFIRSVLLSASLKPFIFVCAASVLLGVLIETVCFVAGKKREKRG